MITRFITEIQTAFNPFSARAKSARLFLSYLPPNARSSGMAISTQLLPRSSTAPSRLLSSLDGKELDLDADNMGIKSIIEEVDRHSRILQKADDLAAA